MTKATVSIRDLRPEDEPRWQEMWADYLAFYEQSLAPEVTMATWRRFFDAGCPLYCLVAVDASGLILGFAAHVVHPGTWGAGDVCYLEDLYVAPQARCRGVARKLIEQLIATGREKSWYRLYWHTDAGNHGARALYDKVGTLSDRVKYDVAL
ncbi:MAG: GNAT family N-acetyltransferase [Rhodospirillales bacterium]|nr:GNAT family N-acetyltransferase [Rhodospirillales bacterium]